jgi:solute carrier family 25 protein 46
MVINYNFQLSSRIFTINIYFYFLLTTLLNYALFINYVVEHYIARGYGLVSLITENLLIHPFIVLRRQCRVNPISKKYHVTPVTLIPIMIRLHQTQGLNILWKGLDSVLIVRGLTMAVEDLLSKTISLPK